MKSYEAIKQAISPMDTPQQQYQYIQSTLHSNKTPTNLPESSLKQSPTITQKNFITDYATTQHNRKRANAQINTAFELNDTDNPLQQHNVFTVSVLTSSNNDADDDDEDDDVDLKGWTAIQSNTMECIGDKQRQIEKLHINNEQLQSQLHHEQIQMSALNEKHNKICIQLDSVQCILGEKEEKIETILEEKEALHEDNTKLNQMYSVRNNEFKKLQKMYNDTLKWKQMYETEHKRYEETRNAVKKYKSKNIHSQCHEVIKQHYDRSVLFETKYNEIKEQSLDTMTQKNKDIKQKYNELFGKYHDIKSKYTDSLSKYTELWNVNNKLQRRVTDKDDDKEDTQDEHGMCNQIIEELKKDLAHAQRSILEMTNVVGVKQKLPTVQETLVIFHSIRDQQHHNTSTELKKYIKKLNDDWNKYYINQLVHELMFDALIKCYNEVMFYRKHIFSVIATELNMRYTLMEAYTKKHMDDDGDGDGDEEVYIESEIYRILSNRFGSYFKDNYRHILKRKEIGDRVRCHVLKEKYAQCLVDIPLNVLDSLNEYILQCCDVCWIMILQDPSLHLIPMEWMSGSGDNVKFDDQKHKRVLGSDRKCTQILYYVWPVIARNQSILDDQKMDVVLRHEMYAQNKQK